MVIDASVWVSGFVPQDTHYLVTSAWLSQTLASGDNLVIPSLALAEVSGAISRRTGVAALGHQSAEQLLNAPGLGVVALDAGLGAEAARVAANLRLRGADAVYVVVAHSMGIPLVTWDQELHVRSSSYIEVLEPWIRSGPLQ